MENAMFLYSEKVMDESMHHVNLFIKPNLHGLGTASFSEADSLIAYGEIAARNVFDQLKALADSINNLGGPAYTRKKAEIIDSVYITSIKVEGLLHMTQKLVTADLPFSVLEWVSVKDITKAVENIYASNYFNKVTYELIQENDGVRLLIKFKERDMGSLRFGFYYDNDYSAMLFLNTTFYNALLKNTKFSATVGLGRTPSIDLLYFIDKGPIPAPGVEIYGQYNKLNIYDDSTRNKLASVNSYFLSSKLFLQSNFTNKVYLRAGLEWIYTKYTPNISLINFGTFINNYATVFIESHFDTFDKAYYATKGVRGNIYAKFVGDGAVKPFMYTRFDFSFAQKLGNKFVLNPKLYGGAIVGDSIPVSFGFPIGGITEPSQVDHFPFFGYKYFELEGYISLIGRVDLRYQFYKKFYATLIANIGFNSETARFLIEKESFISGLALSVGLDSPIGPISVSIAKSPEKSSFIGYVQIGYWF
jgi:NTE family protein